MAITFKSLAKGEFQLDQANDPLQIYQVPAAKRALIKNFTFYVTKLSGIAVGVDAYIYVADSGGTELFRLWWDDDASTLTVATSFLDHFQVVGSANLGRTAFNATLGNIVLESQQQIMIDCDDADAYELDIRVDISGAEEDVI